MQPQTPDFNSFVKGLGVTPGQQKPSVQPWASSLQAAYNKTALKTTSNETPTESPIKSVASSIYDKSKAILDAGANPIKEAANKVIQDYHKATGISDALKTGYNLAGDVAGGVAKSIGGVANETTAKPLAEANSNNPLVKKIANSETGGHVLDSIDKGSQYLSDKWAKFSSEHPEAAKTIESTGNIAQFMALFVPESASVKAPVSKAIDTGLENAKTGLTEGVKTITDTGRNMVESGKSAVQNKIAQRSINAENATFNNKLTDAYESVYAKLTPTEKASIQLKDVGGGITKKSVPDFVNDPKTKPVVEAVSNLPEDIQLKPSDTIATKESKLNQGISRLHQGTDSMLADPKIKAQTSFNEARFNKYMNEKVLGPIKKEFGVDSIEYAQTQKAINSAKKSIESKDAHGVYTGRQKFSAQWEAENPRTFQKAKGSFGSQLDPKTSATVDAGRDVYHALNDFNESLLPENHPLRPRMREESNLIRAKEEMRKRSTSDIDKNALTRSLDRNPLVKKGVKAAGGALKVGTGVEVLSHF